ncbi:MAG: hypothetical protein KDA93_14815 [Planctomycetaceae bacterium]|nr:hypothetical protein [Planctomycetaceae bacterium]
MEFLLQLASLLDLVVWVVRKVYTAHLRAVQWAIAEFNAALPPMSDEEFLRQCSSGVSPEIALRVRAIVSESLGIDYERVYPHTNVVDCC